MNPENDSYTYEDAGFSPFMTRSIDTGTQGSRSREIAFDTGSVSGFLGNILKIGAIELDGVSGRIAIKDENGNNVVIIGELDG